MQPLKYHTEIVGNRPIITSTEREVPLKIGPWPIKRSAASSPVDELKDPILSFSETMAQIDEVYALTKEMEGPEKRCTHGLVSHLRECS
jgi:hypothetical protein